MVPLTGTFLNHPCILLIIAIYAAAEQNCLLIFYFKMANEQRLQLKVEGEEEDGLVFEEKEAVYSINDDTVSTLCNDQASTIYYADDDISTLVDHQNGSRAEKNDISALLQHSMSVEATGCSSKLIEGKETVCCILTIQVIENNKKRLWKIEKSYMDLMKFEFCVSGITSV